VLAHGLARASIIWSIRVHESCADSTRKKFAVSEADERVRMAIKDTVLYVIQFHVDAFQLQT